MHSFILSKRCWKIKNDSEVNIQIDLLTADKVILCHRRLLNINERKWKYLKMLWRKISDHLVWSCLSERLLDYFFLIISTVLNDPLWVYSAILLHFNLITKNICSIADSRAIKTIRRKIVSHPIMWLPHWGQDVHCLGGVSLQEIIHQTIQQYWPSICKTNHANKKWRFPPNFF